jgi:hypothetical protein
VNELVRGLAQDAGIHLAIKKTLVMLVVRLTGANCSFLFEVFTPHRVIGSMKGNVLSHKTI